jgi:hypothetical protein
MLVIDLGWTNGITVEVKATFELWSADRWAQSRK